MNLSAVAVSLALLAANGFFVAAEFALIAARRSRIETLAASGDSRARSALSGIRELSLMLAGAQLGITMVSLGLGAVAEPAVAHGLEAALELAPLPAGLRTGIAFAVALTVVVFLHMVVGEMAPKSWAIADPDKAVLRLTRVFRGFAFVARPFLHLLNSMANGVVRLCGVTPQDELAQVHSPGDLSLLVRESGEQGHLERAETDLLTRALELSGLDAQAVMIARPDIVAVPGDTDVAGLEEVASTRGRSRLLVSDGDLDHVVGVVHVNDLLGVAEAERTNSTAADLAHPALFTPESQPAEDLLVEMRRRRAHLAVVADEFGSVTGVVALEDLLEELIGEFEDESDRNSGRARRQGDGAVVVSGALRPDELATETGCNVPAGDHETVAGFVIASLERLPQEGDAVTVEGARLEVARLDGNRVAEVAVHTAAAGDADGQVAGPPQGAERETGRDEQRR
jgi:CBS domain containing-hemolysin-like protein